jgi:tetratricopeptide (TPR) repeat protein
MEAAGNAYQQADYVEAEKLFKAALREAEKFGEQDPRFATSLNNLAALYQARGKYVEAEPLYKRSLAIREKVLGPDHPDVAASLNNLAVLYKTRGKYVEAEPRYERSLAIREGRAALRALAGDSGEGSGARPSRCSREPQQLGRAVPHPG